MLSDKTLMINKVENTYLNLLRTIILILASVLLIGSIVAGLIGLFGISSFGSGNVSPEKVSADAVIQEMAPEQPKPANPEPVKENVVAVDPFQKDYEKIIDIINDFGKANGDTFSNKTEAVKWVAELANNYNPDTKAIYVKGLSETVDKAVKSPILINRVKVKPVPKSPAAPVKPVAKAPVDTETGDGTDVPVEQVIPEQEVVKPVQESPIDVGIEVVKRFTDDFNANLEVARAETERNQANKMARQASSLMTLYIAGGIFGSFLMIVFFLILVKIERNLRVISEKP